jgi:hypothetical protein
MIAAAEAKRLDRIFSDAALNGLDITRMDIRHNDDDFAYVMGELCKEHKIQVGTLFSRDDIKTLAERNCSPSLACMMYMLKDDETGTRDRVDFVQFYSPQIGIETAEQTLRKIGTMLHDNYGIDAESGITRTKARPPQEVRLNRLAPPMVFEHIPARQPYYQMSLSTEATTAFRDALQKHLEGMLHAIAHPPALDRNARQRVTQPGRQPFHVMIDYASQGDDTFARITPSPSDGRMNEHVEARFMEAGREITGQARREYPSERVISDGRQLVIIGKSAVNAAVNAIDFLDNVDATPRRKPAASKKPHPRVVIVDDLPKTEALKEVAQAPPIDVFEMLLGNAAFKSISVNHSELTTKDLKGLNEKGAQLKKNIVEILKAYLGEKGIGDMEQLRGSNLTEEYTQHYNHIAPFAEMKGMPPGLCNSDLQHAMVMLIYELKTLKKNISPDGHDEGRVSP